MKIISELHIGFFWQRKIALEAVKQAREALVKTNAIWVKLKLAPLEQKVSKCWVVLVEKYWRTSGETVNMNRPLVLASWHLMEVRLPPSHRGWDLGHYLSWWFHFRGWLPSPWDSQSWVVDLHLEGKEKKYNYKLSKVNVLRKGGQ